MAQKNSDPTTSTTSSSTEPTINTNNSNSTSETNSPPQPKTPINLRSNSKIPTSRKPDVFSNEDRYYLINNVLRVQGLEAVKELQGEKMIVPMTEEETKIFFEDVQVLSREELGRKYARYSVARGGEEVDRVFEGS